MNARTWGGLHYRSSTVLAVALGQQLVTNALASFFAPASAVQAPGLPQTGGSTPAGTLPLWLGVGGLLVLIVGLGLQRGVRRAR